MEEMIGLGLGGGKGVEEEKKDFLTYKSIRYLIYCSSEAAHFPFFLVIKISSPEFLFIYKDYRIQSKNCNWSAFLHSEKENKKQKVIANKLVLWLIILRSLISFKRNRKIGYASHLIWPHKFWYIIENESISSSKQY